MKNKFLGLPRLIVLIFIMKTGLVSAQADFRPGYVVINPGDTLYGNIDYRGDMLMSSTCRFKDPEGNLILYSPNDISAYRFIDSKYYISRAFKNKRVFLEYLFKGEVNIYYFRDEDGYHYLIDKEGVRLSEIPYEEGLRYIDNRLVYYESNIHNGILFYYMQDAPGFQSRINKIKKPDHISLIKLAKEYHNLVCDDEKSIIYEKQQPFLKVNFSVTGGLVNFENVQDLNDKFYADYGVLGLFWIPRANEKMYFKTGVFYSQILIDNDKLSVYKIPFQFEYIYPKSLVQPKLGIGVNIYKPFYQTFALSGGINIKLTERFYWSVDYDIDFTPNDKFPVIPKELFSNSFTTGVYIKL